MNHNFAKASVMGLIVGDALGVPVEFQPRINLERKPVVGMIGYGTHDQPAGTWSDDSSMVLATMDSLLHGFDYRDMMDRFMAWLIYGGYTPYGKVFDVGESTKRAIMNYEKHKPPLECGGRRFDDNGNGSLMRILPVILYQLGHMEDYQNAQSFRTIHQASCLTHAHARSQMGCGIYAKIISEICHNGQQKDREALIDDALQSAYLSYQSEDFADLRGELESYRRLFELDKFMQLPDTAINSSGYIVDTLEAAIWCFLNTESYQECVLKAVNLGDDSDTTAAVAGGMAGAFYGYDSIPDAWIKTIAKREWIEHLCDNFEESLYWF